MNNKKIGVLLVNLGTPQSPKPRDVFRYLNEFLTDQRVINIPWLQRQCLVRGMIVPTRYKQSAKLYEKIWTDQGSPLLIHGLDVQNKLQKVLGEQFQVVLAMRYQFPSIKEGLSRLKNEDLDELLLFPLFPQYASATTGSVHQKVMGEVRHWPVIPKLTFINSFPTHPAFIQAFCERAKQYSLQSYDHFLFSFHGLPESHIRQADKNGNCLKNECCKKACKQSTHCYKAQCYATANAICSQLNIDSKNFTVCFQSRLGKDPWIQPYTADVLHSCAQKGHKRLLVFCPSFVCDCLETTCEISYEYSKEFQALGGEEIQLVEGLNSHPAWIDALKVMILQEINKLNPYALIS